MSLIITRNFKRAKAQDDAAADAASDELNVGDKIWITQYGRNYPYTITKKWKEGWTFWYKAKNDKSGKEEIVAEAFANALDSVARDKAPDGWWEGKTIFAAFGWGKSVKGKVVSHKNGVIKLADGTTFKESDAYDLYAIDSRAAKDSIAADAKFKIGDKVKLSGSHPRFPNKVGVVTRVFPTGFIKVKVDGVEDIEIAEHLVSAESRDAGDAAELRVVHAKGIGKWWVEPNLSRFNDADREQTHKGRKEFPDREAAMKYARGTGKTFIVNDACEDSAAKFRIGQEVIVKTKSAEPYKARIVGLWDMSQNGPYNEQGYLIKNIKGGGVESMPEHALSLVTAKDSSELNNDADLRAALSKMADIARRLTDAKVSFKSGWTPEGIGEIMLEFPNIESARKYNYYKLFNAWEAARSQIVPRWAVNIGGYRVPRIEGNRMTISILHFST